MSLARPRAGASWRGHPRYRVMKGGHLGPGHFLDVYRGKYFSTCEKVVIMLVHRSSYMASLGSHEQRRRI